MAHGVDLKNVGLASTLTVRKFGSNAVSTGGNNSLISNNTTLIGTSGQSSRKKLYERMLMIRKVKTYLSEIPFIDSELELDRLSMECEPPAPGANSISSGFTANINNNQNINNNFDKTAFLRPNRRRIASPSPSSLSSHSAQSNSEQKQRMHGSKFGNIIFKIKLFYLLIIF